MLRKYGRLGIRVALIAVPLLVVGLFTVFYSEIEMAREIGLQEPHLSE